MPGSASSEPPVTLSALRDLFDEKLLPVTATLKALQNDFEEHVDMTNTSFENFGLEVDELRGQMKAEINDLKQHVGPLGRGLHSNMSSSTPKGEQPAHDDIKHKITLLESQLAAEPASAMNGSMIAKHIHRFGELTLLRPDWTKAPEE